ncbi:hypothetical protein N2152v2_001636 [Parachlorella kessleri]
MTGNLSRLNSHPVDLSDDDGSDGSNQLGELEPASSLRLSLQCNIAGLSVQIPVFGEASEQRTSHAAAISRSSSLKRAQSAPLGPRSRLPPVRPGRPAPRRSTAPLAPANSLPPPRHGSAQLTSAKSLPPPHPGKHHQRQRQWQQEQQEPPQSWRAVPASAGPGHRPEVEQLRQLVAAQKPGLVGRLEATGETPDGAFFTRWLIARQWDVEHAARDIVGHAEWRESFMGSTASSGGCARAVGSEGQEEERVFLQGCDKSGHPLVVVKAGRHVLSSQDLPTTKRLICCALDLATTAADPELNPLGRVCCLFDLSGLRARDLDAKALGAIFELLQAHYPERLARLYFVNAPFIFWGVWRLVSPFLQQATRDKIRFISGRGVQDTLRAAVPDSILPTEYGGRARLVPLQAAITARRVAAAEVVYSAPAGPAAAACQGAVLTRQAGAVPAAAEATDAIENHKAVGGGFDWRATVARAGAAVGTLGARLGSGALGAVHALRIAGPAGRTASAAGRALLAARGLVGEFAHPKGQLQGQPEGSGYPVKGGSVADGSTVEGLTAGPALEPEVQKLDKIVRTALVCGFCAVAATAAAGVHSVAL